MCSNVQASNSSEEAIEKLIKDGMQCPSKTKTNQVHRGKMKYHLQSAVEHCTFWQLTTKRRTPVQPTVRRRISRSCRSVEDSFCDTARKLEKTPYALRKRCNARFQNDNCSLFSPPKNRARNLCRSQASKTEGSEVAQIAYEVAEQFPQLQIANSQYNGRIQRHKKMALLRGSFTDEEERDKD